MAHLASLAGHRRARLAVVAAAFAGGAATVLLALYLALRTAPGVLMADDMVEVLAVAAQPPLSGFHPGSVVYVKSPVGALLLEKLQPAYPALHLITYSARPEDRDCPDRQPPGTRCERDDFVKLEVLAAPTRASLLVAVGTADAYGEVLLVRFLGRWRVIVRRWYVVR
jgi:hypothetical protein